MIINRKFFFGVIFLLASPVESVRSSLETGDEVMDVEAEEDEVGETRAPKICKATERDGTSTYGVTFAFKPPGGCSRVKCSSPITFFQRYLIPGNKKQGLIRAKPNATRKCDCFYAEGLKNEKQHPLTHFMLGDGDMNRCTPRECWRQFSMDSARDPELYKGKEPGSRGDYLDDENHWDVNCDEGETDAFIVMPGHNDATICKATERNGTQMYGVTFAFKPPGGCSTVTCSSPLTFFQQHLVPDKDQRTKLPRGEGLIRAKPNNNTNKCECFYAEGLTDENQYPLTFFILGDRDVNHCTPSECWRQFSMDSARATPSSMGDYLHSENHWDVNCDEGETDAYIVMPGHQKKAEQQRTDTPNNGEEERNIKEVEERAKDMGKRKKKEEEQTRQTLAVYFKAAKAANCPPAQIVDTKQECEKAGPAVGHPFNKEIPADGPFANDRPAGCFWDQNQQSYFNPVLNASSGWGGVGAVCKATAYFKAAKATNCLPEQIVDTKEECEKAGPAVGHPFNKEIPADGPYANDRPAGCFWDQNKQSYYNPVLNASTRWGGVGAICKKS